MKQTQEKNELPLWSKRGLFRMFFLLRNHCQQLVYLLGKNLSLSVFFVKTHWSDKCQTISDPISQKQFFKQGRYCFLFLKEDHKSRDCKKKKGCFYCKRLQNPAICSERNKKDDNNEEDSPNNLATCHVQKPINTSSIITNSCSNCWKLQHETTS